MLRQCGFANSRQRQGRGDGFRVDLEMNDGGLARLFGSLERSRKIRSPLDGDAEAAKCPGVGSEIRIAQVRGRNAPGIVALLVHANGSVKPVVGNDDDDRGIELDCGWEVLTVHEEIAVAAERLYGAVRV